MINSEHTHPVAEAVATSDFQEIDFSPEALAQLMPQKLLAKYPDAQIAKIDPFDKGRQLTVLISSASAELQPIPFGISILSWHEGGLLYCSMEFMPLEGETEKTIAYISKHDDRQEIRHQGINAEFYQNLYAYLRSQGIKYVFGLNSLNEAGTHPQFFLKKLGRSRFNELPPEFAKKVPDRFLHAKHLLTVQFL